MAIKDKDAIKFSIFIDYLKTNDLMVLDSQNHVIDNEDFVNIYNLHYGVEKLDKQDLRDFLDDNNFSIYDEKLNLIYDKDFDVKFDNLFESIKAYEKSQRGFDKIYSNTIKDFMKQNDYMIINSFRPYQNTTFDIFDTDSWKRFEKNHKQVTQYDFKKFLDYNDLRINSKGSDNEVIYLPYSSKSVFDMDDLFKKMETFEGQSQYNKSIYYDSIKQICITHPDAWMNQFLYSEEWKSVDRLNDKTESTFIHGLFALRNDSRGTSIKDAYIFCNKNKDRFVDFILESLRSKQSEATEAMLRYVDVKSNFASLSMTAAANYGEAIVDKMIGYDDSTLYDENGEQCAFTFEQFYEGMKRRMFYEMNSMPDEKFSNFYSHMSEKGVDLNSSFFNELTTTYMARVGLKDIPVGFIKSLYQSTKGDIDEALEAIDDYMPGSGSGPDLTLSYADTMDAPEADDSNLSARELLARKMLGSIEDPEPKPELNPGFDIFVEPVPDDDEDDFVPDDDDDDLELGF